MGRKLDDLIAALPKDRRERVDARFEELRGEVESLGDLRRAAGKAQAEIASVLKIKQPSVSKIEKQADMYLSTLKSYVEAIGGQLELVVRLPSRAPLRIERLGDVVAPKAVSVRSVKRAAGGRNRTKAARAG
ncbi:helix-turn-helix domain-containing protein [Mesorhizobium sp. M0644]|uniref:XRE family transcriptional regulator n=1 Tax=unclassified Mesorhizobium TaxID=325217 RepID=UPI00333B2BB6